MLIKKHFKVEYRLNKLRRTYKKTKYMKQMRSLHTSEVALTVSPLKSDNACIHFYIFGILLHN